MSAPSVVEVPFRSGSVPVTVSTTGTGGHTVLLLHGGGGPRTVVPFAERYPGRVITPVHPGWDGTPHPDGVATIPDLAELYAGLLDELELSDVTVVGNSIGGWITAELALRHSPRVARYVIVDGVGLDLPETPTVDFFALTMAQVAELSYYTPDAFRIDVDALPPDAQATMAANRETLAGYAGTAMADPTLQGRLPTAAGPTLVVWGAADRIVPIEHGRAYADALPDARLEVIADAGHLPQLETPDRLVALVSGFADE